MSKGSRRRPSTVSDRKMTDNWKLAFGKGKRDAKAPPRPRTPKEKD